MICSKQDYKLRNEQIPRRSIIEKHRDRHYSKNVTKEVEEEKGLNNLLFKSIQFQKKLK